MSSTEKDPNRLQTVTLPYKEWDAIQIALMDAEEDMRMAARSSSRRAYQALREAADDAGRLARLVNWSNRQDVPSE